MAIVDPADEPSTRTQAPTGTVSFLFTDIEGSTRLWDAHPAAMGVALARHDTLMREAIAAHGGHVFKTIGDAFCAAFDTAPDAVEAALEAQRALDREQWAGLPGLKVRMAVHTGAAEERGGDYFGPPLNRVARLLSTGYGGQVLLSLASQELSRDHLPPGVHLRDLGEHCLRDLGRPEHVFQVVAPELPDGFPPLKTLDFYPNNLPVQLTSFIGREGVMEDVVRLLQSARLLTLTGPGGTGKTRLSLQVAAELLDRYPQGVWFIELAPLSDPALLPQAVASVLGVREDPAVPLLNTLTGFLRGKELLLVLDNCEHMVDACARLADSFLRLCPGVRLLASSRERFGIAGESTYGVPALSLPPDPSRWGRSRRRAEEFRRTLGQYEAVRLFVDRARSVHPAFEVTSDNAPAVAELCYRLDGIPLALELAAARIKVLSVEEINARLGDRFRLLTRGSRTALPRQQTLRALIDWSHDILSDQERILLRRLSVFAGGWTLEAAETVCAGEGIEEWEILDLLTQLVDKSLILVEEEPDGAMRYRLLESVREYAREKLTDAEEVESVAWGHLQHYLALAEEAEPELYRAAQIAWMNRLEREQDNLRAALEWCGREACGCGAGSRIVGALSWFWVKRGYLTEGRQRIETALEQDREMEPVIRLKALHGLVAILYFSGHYEPMRAYAQEKLALAREIDDRWHLAFSHFNVAMDAAQEWDLPRAMEHSAQCLALAREEGAPWLLAAAHRLEGSLSRCRHDFEAAARDLDESLRLFRSIGEKWAVAFVDVDWGEMALAWGDPRKARSLFAEGLAICGELGDKRTTAWCVLGMAGVAAGLGEAERAARLLGASTGLLEDIGGFLPPLLQARYEDARTASADRLGPDGFQAAWEEGRGLSEARAISLALEVQG